MTRMVVARFLLLVIALGTAALLASYVGVEKEDRWRMPGPSFEISAFPAAEAWDLIRSSVDGPDSGAAVTSTSPHVVALAGQPASDLLPDDGVTAVVPSSSAFAVRAESGEMGWPGINRIVVDDVSAAPVRARTADLLVPRLAADSSSLVGVLSADPAQLDALLHAMQRAGITADVAALPSPWDAALRRSVHLPLLVLLTGFALVGATIVWHTAARSRWRPAVLSHRLVGASPLRAALLGCRVSVTVWAVSAAAATGVWLLAWPRWDREIGITADTALLWTGLLLTDFLLALGTVTTSLWMRRVPA